jgi:hypothetical protein
MYANYFATFFAKRFLLYNIALASDVLAACSSVRLHLSPRRLGLQVVRSNPGGSFYENKSWPLLP